jgi:hypothetical protein
MTVFLPYDFGDCTSAMPLRIQPRSAFYRLFPSTEQEAVGTWLASAKDFHIPFVTDVLDFHSPNLRNWWWPHKALDTGKAGRTKLFFINILSLSALNSIFCDE